MYKKTNILKFVYSNCRDDFHEKNFIYDVDTGCSRFHTHLCNVHDDSKFYKELKKGITVDREL